MKTLKKMGFAGIASIALVVVAPSTLAETQERSASSSTIHRVSHALANSQQYTNGTASGYKWGESSQHTSEKKVWAKTDAQNVRSGFKWKDSSQSEQTRNRWGRNSNSDQARNRWGRNSNSNQARNRWGRNSNSDQARNRWGRNNSVEQARNRWGR